MILSLDELKNILKDLRSDGKSIVFTNGVFDILHRGHAEYLNKSKKHGNVLIVGVNSDHSVKRLKGENRPVNCEQDRAYLIDSLKAVDITVIFDDDTPYDLIEMIKPDCLVKGGDYDPQVSDIDDHKYIVGSDIVKRNGGKVIVIDIVPSLSTTLTMKKIMDLK